MVLKGSKLFTKLNLVKAKAYYQISLAEDSKNSDYFPVRGFVNSAYLCTNLSETDRQRGLPFAFAYIDIIFVANHDIKAHYEHLRQVFEILADFSMKVNINKCGFTVSNLS